MLFACRVQPLKRAIFIAFFFPKRKSKKLPEKDRDLNRRKLLEQSSLESLPTDRQAFCVAQVADKLGVTPKSIYRLIQRGLVKSLKPFRHHRIPRKELDRFLLENL